MNYFSSHITRLSSQKVQKKWSLPFLGYSKTPQNRSFSSKTVQKQAFLVVAAFFGFLGYENKKKVARIHLTTLISIFFILSVQFVIALSNILAKWLSVCNCLIYTLNPSTLRPSSVAMSVRGMLEFTKFVQYVCRAE